MQALESAYLLPKSVQDILPDATAAGLCGPAPYTNSNSSGSTFGWVLHRASLLVWRVEEDLHATVRRLQLPQAPRGRVFVSVLPHAGSSVLTVALCTSGGLLCVWLDATFFAPPFTQQLFVSGAAVNDPEVAIVSAMAAGAADAGGAPGFIAVIATADGALHLYHGSQQGIFPRQFHRPTAAAAGGGGGGATGAAGGAAGAGGADGSGSLLGSLGGVVRALYSEAFDPLYKIQRPAPSSLPARQLLLLRAGGDAGAGGAGAWRLLALAPDALDCWALGAANAASAADERLLWSFSLRNVLLSELRAQDLEPLAFAVGRRRQQQHQQQHTAAGGQSQLLVWSSFQAPNSVAQQHVLSAFDLRTDTVPYYDSSVAAVGAAAGALPRLASVAGGAAGPGWRLLAHGGAGGALARAPNGAVVEWAPGCGEAQVLASGPDNLDAACSGSSDLWQVLNARYGVLLMAAAGAAPSQPPPGAAALAGGGAPGGQAVLDLLEATVGLMVREYLAGCPYAELAEGLGDRLERLGLYDGGATAAGLVVSYSSSIVDQVPKEVSAAASLHDQLARKALRHDMLLTALETGGALRRLPGAVAAALFAHAEQLAAAGGALDLLPELGAAVQDGVEGAEEMREAAAAALDAAGAAASEGTPEPPFPGTPAWEPFFARPTAGAPALFRAVASVAGALRGALEERGGGSGGAGAEAASTRLQGLGMLLGRAVLGAEGKRDALREAFRDADARRLGAAAAAGGGWLCSHDAREAWDQLAQACLLLKPRLPSLQARLQLDSAVHLPATAALLLAAREGMRAATATAAVGGAARDGAARDAEAAYVEARERHAGSLLQDAKEELDEMRAEGLLPPADEAAASSAASALVWRVESLALEHGCHPQLFDAVQLLLAAGLDDAGRLASHMHKELAAAGAASSDPHGTFTFYAMNRLRQEGRVRELLHLGRQGFRPQLLAYLAPHPHLLWLAQAAGGWWGDAAESLLVAAQSVQDSLPERRRMMALAKLSALAASPAEDAYDARYPRRAQQQAAAVAASTAAVPLQRHAGRPQRQDRVRRRAEGELQGMRIQEELAGEAAAHDVTPKGPDQLAAEVLQGGGGGPEEAPRVILALQALAAAPSELRERNSSLWEAAWLRLLDLSDPGGLAQLRQLAQQQGGGFGAGGGGGGAGEEYSLALESSPLFEGLVACAAALLACTPAGSSPSATDVLEETGTWLRARAAGDAPLQAALDDAFSAAAAAAAPLLMAEAEA